MADVLKLSKPIMINDVEVNELPYDFENMTARDKLNAGKVMKTMGYPPGNAEELDQDYHLFLFAAGVNKADPKIDVTDVLRISAKDVRQGIEIVRRFFYLSSAE